MNELDVVELAYQIINMYNLIEDQERELNELRAFKKEKEEPKTTDQGSWIQSVLDKIES